MSGRTAGLLEVKAAAAEAQSWKLKFREFLRKWEPVRWKGCPGRWALTPLPGEAAEALRGAVRVGPPPNTAQDPVTPPQASDVGREVRRQRRDTCFLAAGGQERQREGARACAGRARGLSGRSLAFPQELMHSCCPGFPVRASCLES